MDLKTGWYLELQQCLLQIGVNAEVIQDSKFLLLKAVDCRIVINCISLNNDHKPDQAIAIQKIYFEDHFTLIHLWEDIWVSRKVQVLNRLGSLTGKNNRIHGRKTKAVTLNKVLTNDFLDANHIQGPALARHKYGLLYDDELVAVATFSGTRLMKQKSEGYRSSELIRFATKPGYTITGGLSKLIKHFASVVSTNDIMSYADRDWSMGKGYESAGFTFDSLIPASELWLDISNNKRYFHHRLPKLIDNVGGSHFSAANLRFVKIFNTGNLKYILYL